MAPKSIVVRLSRSLVAGYNTYGFDEAGGFADLARIHDKDLPGREFWLGGELVRALGVDERERLKKEGVHLFENSQRLLADVAKMAELRKA
jgi:CRISPR-associated protein Cst2